jgi:hypothetical protein
MIRAANAQSAQNASSNPPILGQEVLLEKSRTQRLLALVSPPGATAFLVA